MFYPQPMEIAFSLEAGSFSSDLFETQASLGQVAVLPNAFVVCFENVLIPVKWMVENIGLRPTVRGIQEAKDRAIQNPYLFGSLARIEQAAIQLLTAIASHGPVCVLGEESARFVESVCQVFFPRLAYCLSSPHVLPNVQVVGAPKKFVLAAEKAAWRIQLMQSLVRDQLFAGQAHLLANVNTGRFGLVVASPHQVDVTACSRATEVAPFLIPKCVRAVNARRLQLDQFIVHLQGLEKYLVEAAPCPTPFAVNM